MLSLKNQLIESLEIRLHNQHLAPREDDDETGVPSGSSSPLPADLYRMKILTDDDWQNFREKFGELFPGYIFRLKDRFPDLTPGEVRLFMLSKLHFNTREISEALGISIGSVYRNRHRLVKKLGIEGAADLDEFVQKFG